VVQWQNAPSPLSSLFGNLTMKNVYPECCVAFYDESLHLESEQAHLSFLPFFLVTMILALFRAMK
jgi:hypothetical protein